MSVRQWKICKLNNIKEKSVEENSLRRLWRDCFEDPFEYENYYFQNVYPGNTVYMLEYGTGHAIGMLHLNPYSCKVNGTKMLLHYIVGVATAKEARRQGVMRKLLSSAILGLYEAEEPFTYLMPADVRYYEPFDFVPVCAKEEWRMEKTSGKELSFDSSFVESDVIYMDYSNLEDCFKEDMDCLLSHVDLWLEDHYSGFASHDREYFDLLAREKGCENGAVIFCFDQVAGLENLLGFFAYGREGETVFVEQNVLFETAEWNLAGEKEKLHVLAGREQVQEILQGYFGNALTWQTFDEQKNALLKRIPKCPKIRYIASYPYMVRVVHVESFLKLYADCFSEYAENGTRLYVEDLLVCEAVERYLPESSKVRSYTAGVYTFSRKDDKILVCKQEASQVEYDVKMTVSELARYVFGKKGKKLFFAELV